MRRDRHRMSASDVVAPQGHDGSGGGRRRILDVTHAFRAGLPVLGSGAGVGPLVRRKNSMANGSFYNLSELRMSVHTGNPRRCPRPHVAAILRDWLRRRHARPRGPALLVDVPRDTNITVLFRTQNTDKLMWQTESDPSCIGFTEVGTQWLVSHTGFRAIPNVVRVDYLSVVSYDYLIPTHVLFSKSREIVIVEALKLDDAKPV
ncbi:hypothetical protein ABZP36_011716, partial [Zizania latifolia]